MTPKELEQYIRHARNALKDGADLSKGHLSVGMGVLLAEAVYNIAARSPKGATVANVREGIEKLAAGMVEAAVFMATIGSTDITKPN